MSEYVTNERSHNDIFSRYVQNLKEVFLEVI